MGIEVTEELSQSRRRLLKWTTPVIALIALPVHAQTSVTTPPAVPPVVPPIVPPSPMPTGNVVITEILWRQTASSDPNVLVDEYVEIRNNDVVAIQLQGWSLTDAGPFSFTFPARVLQPGETCRIFAHVPQGANTWPCEFTFGRTSPGSSGNYVWNNSGDMASLSDASGMLIDMCAYSSSAANPFSC